MNQGGCYLCGEIGGTNPLSQRLSRRRAAPLVQSDRFVAIPDLVPIIPGHSLVVSKAHIPAIADLTRGAVHEFEEVLGRARAVVTAGSGAPFVFEHGPGPGRSSGCCIDHAHVHLIPLRAPVEQWLADVAGDFRYGTGDMAATLADVRSGYLYYQDQTGLDMVIDKLEEPVPSQFLRRRLGRFLAIDNWDWRVVLARRWAGQGGTLR